MTITFLSDEYEQLWQDARLEHNTKLADDQETVRFCPQQLGCGCIRTIDLRGIELSILDYQVHEDLNVIFDFPPGDSWLEFGFHLSGSRSGKRAGQNFATWGTTLESEIWATETSASEQILKVDLGLELYRYQLKNFVTGDLNRFPRELQQLLEGDPLVCYEQISTVTPAMRLAVEQILYCPFAGTTKQIYLESKCLELIALKIEQLAETQNSCDRDSNICLKADDIDRIHHARNIITDNFNNPPSLSNLAKQVELNECTLKRGFRQVFNTTVFGYLHHVRMEQAYQLLLTGANVTEAAKAVGYASTTSFSAAFRKKFGTNPRAYRHSRSERGITDFD